jgi:alpha-L-fucosidase
MKTRFLLWVIFLLQLTATAGLAIAPGETEEAFHQRMQWWEEGRLGMFLHWGVYSTFGGEYQGEDFGKEMGNAGAEWIYLKADIPQAEYEEAARAFNPGAV